MASVRSAISIYQGSTVPCKCTSFSVIESAVRPCVAGVGYVGGTSQVEVETVSAANAEDASCPCQPSAADGATEGGRGG